MWFRGYRSWGYVEIFRVFKEIIVIMENQMENAMA